VVGALAVGATYVATLTTLIVFGSVLLAGGVVQTVNAFLARTWRGSSCTCWAGSCTSSSAG
jgi:uncharacterized membrane protein HdeD (DUF308 family)